MKRNVLSAALTAVFLAGIISGCAAPAPKAIFNGKDLTGWTGFVPDKNVDPGSVWTVKNGVIRCTGKPAGYLRTVEDYSDYHLHVEWRWPEKGGNSGVLVHMSQPDVVWPKSIECQLMSGNAGDFYVIGGTDFQEHKGIEDRRVPKKTESSELPLGQWNEYDIYCRADTIEVYVNGVMQNKATQTTARAGKICLQSEGTPIEFRNVYIVPLR